MRINRLALFCFTLAGLQGCASNGPNNSPALPQFERTTALPREQVAIDNSEFVDEELAASSAAHASH